MSMDRSMDSDDDKIVEDVPRMRSVSMMASPSAMIREAPHLVKEYGSVPQSPFAPKAAPLVKTAPVVLPSLPSSWTNPTLETIPLYYRLERTHATVRAEPAVVAQRLSDCFRGQSMGTVYHDNEACVNVETCDSVSFAIRLWKSEEANQVVVEVQRTSGCCFLFHQASKAVLRAASGATATKPSVVFTLPKCIPQESEAERLACLKEGLDICSCLLQSGRMDSHLMALESLVKISECSRSREYAARCILGSGEFLQTLVSLIQTSSLSSSPDNEANRTITEKEHLALMHRHAMTVLANCLSTLQEKEDASDSALQADVTSDTTLMALIDRVAHCDKRPHDACQAVRCLQELVVLKNSDCKQRALALGLASHADFAKQLGDRRHVQLYTESQKLLHQLKD